MTRYERVLEVRQKLRQGKSSVGTWMQLPSSSCAELLASQGYDWVTVDLEHGHFDTAALPDLMRAIELAGSLPLARVAEAAPRDVKSALDAGAGGVILPMIRSASQVRDAIASCRWPPAGSRGVGFSRANLFGERFADYRREAEAPLVVPQIENSEALDNLPSICAVPGVDAVLLGPYDLSSSLGVTGEFEHPAFKSAVERFLETCEAAAVPAGLHVVWPDPAELQHASRRGFRFLAYSIDAVFLRFAATRPELHD